MRFLLYGPTAKNTRGKCGSLPRQAVSKRENGTSGPSKPNLPALAKLYGIDLSELLRGVQM